jgi:ABC-type sugar transport system ATPase subunit
VASSLAADDGTGVVLRARELTKSFGPTVALRACTMELRGGEVHALVGENGSGKSTFVKLLTGVYRPDSGTIELAGGPPAGFRSPRQAMDAGIAAVHQELLLAEGRSVLDNVLLGPGSLLSDDVPRRARRAQAAATLHELAGCEIALDRPVEELPFSQRHACCIARALVRAPRILLLDEPSAALDIAMRERLLSVVRRVVSTGTGVIIISHRLDEVEEIADRVTVLRAGQTVATLNRGQTSPGTLLRHMAGAPDRASRVRGRRPPGNVVLRARGIRLRPAGPTVDLDVRAGEIVGLAGLDGNGQEAFLQALRGRRPLAGTVTRELGGRPVEIRTPRGAARAGIAYVPRDRAAEGVFGDLSTWENFALPTLRRDAVAGWLRPAASARRLDRYVRLLRIRLGTAADPLRNLSGGNQQKVILARWLAYGPAILLLDDPTRGVDPATRRDVYGLLTAITAGGVAIVLRSTELDELVEVADRVLVFRHHGLGCEMAHGTLTRETVLAGYFGRAEGDA